MTSIMAVATTLWGLTSFLALALGWLLIHYIKLERVYKSPNEKGYWSPLVPAVIIGLAGFPACLIVFL